MLIRFAVLWICSTTDDTYYCAVSYFTAVSYLVKTAVIQYVSIPI